jgi:hypothetical protein
LAQVRRPLAGSGYQTWPNCQRCALQIHSRLFSTIAAVVSAALASALTLTISCKACSTERWNASRCSAAALRSSMLTQMPTHSRTEPSASSTALPRSWCQT